MVQRSNQPLVQPSNQPLVQPSNQPALPFGLSGLAGLRAKDVIKLVIASKKQADEDGETMRLVFRDPLIFKEKLLNSEVGDVVATQV